MVSIHNKYTVWLRSLCTGGINSHLSVTEQLPSMYISELRVDILGQDFIELCSGDHGSSPLDGLILVFFNGANQDKSYLEIDLDGAR